MVQEVFWICEAKNETETDELPEPMGTQEFKSWKMVGSQQRRQETGGLKDKREESQEK